MHNENPREAEDLVCWSILLHNKTQKPKTYKNK
jgi:hypothetical protein